MRTATCWLACLAVAAALLCGGDGGPSAQGPKPARALKGHTDNVYAVAFSSDGTRLASGSLDGTVRLWDMT